MDPFMLLPSLVNFGMGLYQSSRANSLLDELNREALPRYTVSPELQNAYDRAEQNARYGYSPQERAAFVQRLSQRSNTAYRRALDMSGGNLAQALNRGIQAANISAETGFAADDAGLKRRNITYADTLGRAIQSQKNLQTQNEIQQRRLEEQALGTAASQGMTNMVNAVGGAGSLMYADNLWDNYFGRPTGANQRKAGPPTSMVPEDPSRGFNFMDTPVNTGRTLYQELNPEEGYG